jgi:radical SAM superfamily enzyme YgiQ (UPF0313 family)
MKRAGCYRLTFGLESGDPDTISFIRKRYSVEKARDTIRFANRLGMWTVGTFILGFPYENAQNIKNTVDFACSLGLDLAMFYCATPHPGSDLYAICRREGIDTAATPHTRGYSTVHMTVEDVERERMLATVRFMNGLKRRPWKPLGKIRSWEDLHFTCRVVMHSVRMLFGRSASEKLGKYPNYQR